MIWLSKMQIPIHITKIETFGLKNVETFGGENDPYAMLSFGSWKAKTKTIDDGGSNVHWDYGAGDKDMQFSVSSSDLGQPAKTFDIVVMDENKLLAHKLIGEAKVPLPALLSSSPNQHIQVEFQLQDKSRKPTGRVVITMHHFEND